MSYTESSVGAAGVLEGTVQGQLTLTLVRNSQAQSDSAARPDAGAMDVGASAPAGLNVDPDD